jgi:hypothetical protein
MLFTFFLLEYLILKYLVLIIQDELSSYFTKVYGKIGFVFYISYFLFMYVVFFFKFWFFIFLFLILHFLIT